MIICIAKNVVGTRLGSLLKFCFARANILSLSINHRGILDNHMRNDAVMELEDFFLKEQKEKMLLIDKKDVLYMRSLNNIGISNYLDMKSYILKEYQDNILHIKNLLDENYYDDYEYDLSDYKVLDKKISFVNDRFLYDVIQDIYFFDLDDKLMEASLSMESLFSRFYLDSFDFENLCLFKNEKMIFGIKTQEEYAILDLTDDDYLVFQKLKIRHTIE